jgi:hypothetical protein
MAGYEIWLDDPRGNRLALADKFESLQSIRVASAPGACTLVLPPLYDDYLMPDGIIEVWRKGEGGALRLFDAYMYRKWDFEDAGGFDRTILSGKNGLSLLDRRIVAYAAGTTSSAMTDQADDLMKQVVREACTTAATDTGRDWSGLNFTVAANLAAAPTISLGFAYRRVPDVLKDAAEASRNAGTRLYYDVRPTIQTGGTLGWRFVTAIDQPGIDRTGADQLVFSQGFGNLAKARLTYDYSDEVTVVYSLGQGLEEERVVEEVEDTTRSARSVWGRIEESYNAAGMASTTAQVEAAGKARLSERRPRLRLAGTLIDSEQARFQRDWDFGYRVVVAYRGRQFDAVINAVTLTVDGRGKETITGGFELI